MGAIMAPVTAALAPVAPYLAVAGAGMSILGAANSAAGQREAGAAAYANAQIRNQQAQAQAAQLRAAAIADEAAGQRGDIEAQRKASILASRARAVMAASGAGVDPKLLASLIGEGDYAGSVAEFNAGERARVKRDQATMTEWGGRQGLAIGQGESASLNRRADSTLWTGIAGAGLSLAAKYGGGFGKDAAAVPGNWEESARGAVDKYGPTIYDPSTGLNSVV